MSSRDSKKSSKQPRGAAAKVKSLLPGLDAPAEVVELLGDLWAPIADQKTTPTAAAKTLRLRLGDGLQGWEAARVRGAREALDRWLGKNGDTHKGNGDNGRAARVESPREVTHAQSAVVPMPALLARAHSGERPFGFTFGGQSATGFWDELVSLHQSSRDARALAAAVSQRFARELEAMTPGDRAYFTEGLDLASWLEDPAAKPSDAYLNGTIVSQPVIFVAQAGQYLRLLASGYGRDELWTSVKATAGHSQGIMPALLVSETWGSTDIMERACDYAAYLLFQGLRMRQAYLAPAVPPALLAEALKADAGAPSPMASVSGLTSGQLQAVIAKLGLDLYVSLDNARLRKVVSGAPAELDVLRRALADDYTEKKKAKSQGRYGGNLVEREFQYLPFGGAYHSPHMAAGVDLLIADCKRMGFTLAKKALKLPVLDACTGEDLRDAGDIVARVVRLQFVEPVKWLASARGLFTRGARTVIDFGPGEGVYRMTAAAMRGTGALVLGLAVEAQRALVLRADEAPAEPVAYATFAPSLIETADGKVRIDNRYTRFTGHSPVILPGMTPTTVDADIVVAAANAGHVSELAGGGQVTVEMFRKRMAEIARKLAPGAGVVLNALYLDPYLWKLQFGDDKLVMRLRDEGYPLVGVTVSAGIPPVEEAAPLLRELVAHGMWLNSLKPGTDDQIKTVLAIADAVPEITLTIQIEGGKAGGHHSWEDLHDVLARNYEAIRSRQNLLLAVGGGIAREEQATAYLTGSWSLRFDLPAMPVDAVFLGTVTMAAKEAKTAKVVKQELVDTAGTERWVLDAAVEGGVTSGRSQLDASIHYVDNHAARAGRLLDAIAREPDTIPRRKAEIVAALAKTAKPYFGDVEDMTYAGFLARVVELMAIGEGGDYEDGRWLDVTHRRRVLDLVRMAEARLHGGTEAFASICPDMESLDDPEAMLARFAAAYPHAKDTRVHPQDARAFVETCKGGGKPVNFVPVIDRDVRRWYKSDSLWQSHSDRFAPGATHVIPGPEAVAGIRAVDEPVAEILGRFEAHTVKALATAVEARKAAWASERRRELELPEETQGTLRADTTLGETGEAFRARIAAQGVGPLAAALTCAEAVIEAKGALGEVRVVQNPLVRLFAPGAGHSVEWRRDADGTLREIVLEDADDKVCVRARLGKERDGRYPLAVHLVTPSAVGAGDVELDACLDWVEHHELGRLVWRYDDHLNAQVTFYAKAIFGGPVEGVAPFEAARDEVTVTREAIAAFALATGDDSRGVIAAGEPALAPLNMGFALAWRSIFRSFVGVRPDVVGLLHEDNAVRAKAGWPVREGDVLSTTARMTSNETTPAGRRIVVVADLARGDVPVAQVQSTFFIRTPFRAGTSALERHTPYAADLRLADAASRELLLEQPWLTVADPSKLTVGSVLRLECGAFSEVAEGEAREFRAEGVLQSGAVVVGAVALKPEHVPAGCRRHPVAELCALLAAPSDEVRLATARTLGTKVVTAPAEMGPYARASGDHNPLHVWAPVARFAGLPGPIVHGMWTASAAMHRVVRLAAEGDARRITEVEARFLAPVDRGAPLAVRVRHIGMRKGSRLVELDASVVANGREQPVLSGRATLAPPHQAYVFPGQGVQRPGMGMAAYARSAAARAVWDEAETVCRESLGFSLLRVVRDNPKELVVREALLKHPNGVLFLTQFTQVAMAVMAIAQVRELEEKGAFNPDAWFCGHSVGEYSALGAIAKVVPLRSVVQIVYQRGTTMDALIERDAHGHSPYAMGVIRPHYAGLKEEAATALVSAVSLDTGLPLEIVNYNIRGKQYSVTGHKEALAVLASRLADLQLKQPGADPKPAYLTVEGIDVPFHSTLLRNGVPLFRETLLRSVPEHFDNAKLVGRYIPNLVARPFEITRDFAEAVLEASDSPVVAELLADWDDAAKDPEGTGHKLFIELLAYQFASPVRWIETQDLLFAPETALEQLIEVGSGEQPILSNMAQATLAGMPYRTSRPRVMHVESHADELLGPAGPVEEDALPRPPMPGPSAPAAAAPAPVAAPAAPSAAPAAAPAPAAPVAAGPAASGASLADAPPSVSEALKLVLALQTKTRPEQLRDTETVDELLGGNSAKRNQVLADVGGEFGVGAIDGAHELPLTELAAQLQSRAQRYQAPGRYLGAALEQAVAKTLGAARFGKNEVVEYVSRAWGLGPGRALGVALRIPLAARDGASPRGGALSPAPAGAIADKGGAEAWLDALVTAYGNEHGLNLQKPSAAVPGAAAQVDAGALLELEEKLFGKDGALARAAKALRPGADERAEVAVDAQAEAARARLAAYEREHGEAYEAATAAQFDPHKHVAFTSSWTWARRDVVAYAAGLERGATPSAAELRRLARRLDPVAVRATLALAQVAEREGRAEHAAALQALAAQAKATPAFVADFIPTAPGIEADEKGEWRTTAVPRPGEADPAAFVEAQLESFLHPLRVLGHESGLPVAGYKDALVRSTSTGLSFAGKTALITGAGPGAIALEIVRAFLAGGGRVVLTTSSYTPERIAFYKRLYQACGAPGSELHLVPANQGSFADVEALVKWMATAQPEAAVVKGAWLPDYVAPFGALGETSFLGGSSKTQAVLRVLLLGVEKLIAAIADAYEAEVGNERKCHVLLPLSPNHGTFGGDGVYAESKAALEAVLNKWRSEQGSWGKHTTVVGARIGWVRSTGLMSGNDLLAGPLEADTGVRTYGNDEMGLLLTALCGDEVREASRREPLVADLTGGFANVKDLADRVAKLRADLARQATDRKRVRELRRVLDERLTGGKKPEPALVMPRAAARHEAPVPTETELAALPALDHLDLSRVVVVVGYGEASPYGSSRTRWGFERDGVFSLEGAVELAWIMGLIRPRKDGAGWEDVKSGEAVADVDVKARYEKDILGHVGIRVTDPSVANFDPRKGAVSFAEVRLDQDFAFRAASRADAEAMKSADPDHTSVLAEADGSFTVVRKRGAVVRVPKALRIDRDVAGQVPTGWDAQRYGLSKEMCDQVDRVTLFNLVATAEAFVQAGMDPEEIYAHLHPSRVTSTQSSGIGGMEKLARLYKDYVVGRDRQTDTLQETLINVIAGYVVQTYLGSYGAMSFPVGACATAAISVQNAVEQILANESDFVVTGAVDDYSEEGAIGFADMKATASTEAWEKHGIEPRYLSRPNDRRRKGFVEAQGAGALLLARGSLAAKLGLPVYGVVAYAGSFSDGIHRSVPAPGIGVLASAAEAPVEGRDPQAACDLAGRRARIAQIEAKAEELAAVLGEETAKRMVAEARRVFGHEFFHGDPTVSPLRGALAVLGLGPDDIAAVSKHDTSTTANDLNENRLHSWLQQKLGRTADLPLMVISQKSLTGHPKGAAAAWQMAGLMQAMADGVVPGNRSLEDVDPAMAELMPMTFTDEPLELGRGRLRAGLVTSLGFGHVGAIVALAHAHLFWRMLSVEQRSLYAERLAQRRERATQKLQRVLAGLEPLLVLRTRRPFEGKDGTLEQSHNEAAMLLDSRSRLVPGASIYGVNN